MGTPLEELVDSLPDPCVVLAPVYGSDGRVTDFEYVKVNDRACEYNGQTRGELLGRRLLEMYPYHATSGLFDRYVEVLDTGVAFSVSDLTLPPEAANGAFRYFDNLVLRVSNHLILRWRDRTREHAQAELLAESERRYRFLAGQISDVVYECDKDGTTLWVSPSVLETLGWSPEDMLGKRALEFMAPEDIEPTQVHRDVVLKLHRQVRGVECRFRTKSGGRRWVAVSARPLLDGMGEVTGSVVGLRDIQDEVVLRRAVDTLSAANAMLVRAKDEDGLLQSMCETTVARGGYLFAWYGRPLHDEARTVKPVAASVEHSDYLNDVRISWGDNKWGRGPTGASIRTGTVQMVPDFVQAGWTTPWHDAAACRGFRSSISLPVFVDGEVDGALMVYAAEENAFDDDTCAVMDDLAAQLGYGIARLRDAANLAKAMEDRQLLTTAIDQASDAIVVTDLTPVIRYANPAVERVTGFALEDMLGQNPSIFQSGLHDQHFYDEMWSRLLGGRTWRGVLMNRRKNGEIFEEDASITPVHDLNGERIAYVAVKHDLTRERSLEAAVTRDQMDRDAIISVLRDVRPGDTLAESAGSLCHAIRTFDQIDGVMVIFIREDGTAVPVAADGPLPDGQAFGVPIEHERLDLLLAATRKGPWWMDFRDLTGLAGADPEFTSLMRDLGFTAAGYGPIRWEGETIGVLAVATASPTSHDWMPGRLPMLSELGSFAGMLLGPQAVVHTQHEAHRRQILDIIDHERFHIVYEPVVHLPTGTTVGHEALTRFDGGFAPDRCFDLAQSVGLGSALEAACARAALRDATRLPTGNWLAVNFSPSAVIDGSATAVVKGSVRDIVVEITEHNQIDNYAAVRHAIAGCGTVRIAVDDAGAGFASLRHILELQPDIIKLDIALVRDIDIDPARQALAAGLRHFASLTGTTLVAEGVETMAEANAVRTLGVELAQGYLFSRVHDGAVLPLP
jgi:PAS domain S-box-containing protein